MYYNSANLPEPSTRVLEHPSYRATGVMSSPPSTRAPYGGQARPRKQTHDRRLSHIVGHPLDVVSLQLEIGDESATATTATTGTTATTAPATADNAHRGGSPNRTGILSSSTNGPLTNLAPQSPVPLYTSQRNNLEAAGKISGAGHLSHLSSSIDSPRRSPNVVAGSGQIFSHRELEQELGSSAAQNLTIQELRERYYVGPIDTRKNPERFSMHVVDCWEDTAYTNYFRTGRPGIYAVKCQFR